MLLHSLTLLLFSYSSVAYALTFAGPDDPSDVQPILTGRQAGPGLIKVAGSACGILSSFNTTTDFSIIHNDSVTNTTSVLQALLRMQWDIGHANISTSCNGSTSRVLLGDSVVGAYSGSYVPSDTFAEIVVGALISDIKANSTINSIIMESCTINSYSAGQSMGIIVGPSRMVPKVQNTISTWARGDCLTATSMTETPANPWKIFSLDLRRPSLGSDPSPRNLTGPSLSSVTPTEVVSLLPTTILSVPCLTQARTLNTRSDCSTMKVESGDSCGSLASKCGISGQQFTLYNPQPNLCSALTVEQHVCCTTGTLPDYAPKPQSNGKCTNYTVAPGDSCSSIASANSLIVDALRDFNNNTWGFPGCDSLQTGTIICLSTGDPPMPAAVQNAVCGPQCGNTDDFCTPSKSASGAPGTAAPGHNGCISNCGTQIVSSDPPPKVFTVGYFEGFNSQRPCLNMDASSIDVSKYTHLHFGFADMSSSYAISINDNMTDQWQQFLALRGPARVLSFGGWAFSTDVSTYTIFRNGVTAANRQNLANSVASFVSSSGVDGVDFDWEYPGAPDIPGIPPANPNNGQNYLAFLKLLRAALPSEKVISVSAPASYWYLRDYPIAEISTVVDYIVFMTYDLHGQWDYGNNYTDPSCPDGSCLRSQINSTETHTALSMITKAGVPSNKILVGLTSYGRSFEMTQAGFTGPMCTFTGPQSGATPGECTQTAGYLAQAEIDQILSTDSSASTHYDSTSDSDFMVYNGTQWVSYMSNNTRIARTKTYLSSNFLGTVDWSIDLAAFDREELESIEPLPNCTDYGKYKTMDDILGDSNIPDLCMNMYIVNVLAQNMTGSLSDYQSMMHDGYSGKYNAYAEQVRNQGQSAWQDIWDKQNTYWNCFQTDRVTITPGDFYYVLKDQKGFCEMLQNDHGLDCDWITTQVMPYHTSSSSVGCECFGECPSGGTMYWPDLNRDFPVLDPAKAIASGLSNYTNFSDWLSDAAVLSTLMLSMVSDKDVIDAASSVVFGLSGSVQAMGEVAAVGKQAEAEKEKDTVIAFLTAFLLVIPGIGEAVDGIEALIMVARIAKMADLVGNTALSIYDVVQDPSSAPMAVAGIMFGAVGLRDEEAWAKAATKARSMSQDVIKSMGTTVADGLGKIKQATKGCSI